MTPLHVLANYAERAGIALTDEAFERFAMYRDLLLDANARVNLTRLTDPLEFEQRVLVESVALTLLIPSHATSVLDLGSGGGIPGIPIAIARPDIQVVLLDSTAKKVTFLRAAAIALKVNNVTAITGRAEDVGRDDAHRERFDVVTARAVARLATLVELALPLIGTGGVAILPKGENIDAELAEAQYAIRMLHGRERPVITELITGSSIVVIDKRGATPAQFPRRTGVPNKIPLLG